MLAGWSIYLSMEGTIVALLALTISGAGVSVSSTGMEGGESISGISSFSGTSVTMAL
jgi:hypothetical protein